MTKELNLFVIKKILSNNKKSIFLITLIFCIASYVFSYTSKEKYRTNIKFLKPQDIILNFDNKLSLDQYLIESLKEQKFQMSQNSIVEKNSIVENIELLFFKNISLISNFENFINKKNIKEILKKDSKQILSNILSENFNIEQKFLITKNKKITYYELEIIHSKNVLKDLELVLPMYLKYLQNYSLIQSLQLKYSILENLEKIFFENLKIARILDLNDPLYLHSLKKQNGVSSNIVNNFLYYEGTKILEEMINNTNNDKIKIEEKISALKSENEYSDKNFLIKTIGGKFTHQSFLSPNRLIYSITGLLFGFIISLIFIFIRIK